MKAAIAAKEAQEAADAISKAAKVAQAAAAAPLKVNSKVRKGVEFRGRLSPNLRLHERWSADDLVPEI